MLSFGHGVAHNKEFRATVVTCINLHKLQTVKNLLIVGIDSLHAAPGW